MANLVQGVGLDDMNWQCSACHEAIFFEDDPDPSWWHYCPCCGAKIDLFVSFRELLVPIEQELEIDEAELDEFIELLKDLDSFEE